MPKPSELNRRQIRVESQGETRIMPFVVVFALIASIASVIFLLKTVWFSVDHESSCQDLRSKAFQSLNRGDRIGAIANYQQALKEAKQSDNLLQAPAVLSELGDAYLQEKDFPRAEESFRSSLRIYQQMEATEGSKLQNSSLKTLVLRREVDLTIKLAKLLEQQGKLSQAQSLYPQALAKVRNLPDSLGMDADIERAYVRVLEQTGQSGLARQIRADLVIDTSGFGGFQSQLDEGITQLTQGKVKEGNEAIQIAAIIAERHHDRSDLITAHAWLGACALAQGQLESAERAYKEVLADNAPVHGMSEANKLVGLAASLELQGKKQEAELLYKKAMFLNPADVVIQLCIVAVQYELNGNYLKAQPLRLRAVCIRSNSVNLPPVANLVSQAIKTQDAILTSTIFYLANNYHQQKKHAQAAPLYEALSQILVKITTRDFLVAAVALAVADHFCEAGQYAKAEPIYEKAILIANDPKYKRLVARSSYYAQAANNCRALGKHKESMAFFWKELSILREHKDGRDNHPVMAQCLIDLAGELFVLGRDQEAEPFCRQAAKEYQQLKKNEQIAFNKNKSNLVQYLRKLGHLEAVQLLSDQITETSVPH